MDDKIKLAQSIMYCRGDIYEKVDGDNVENTIANIAIYDLYVHGGCELKKKYLANKEHNGWKGRFRMDYFHAPAYNVLQLCEGKGLKAQKLILTTK